VANKVRGDADRKLIEERLKEPVVAVLPFDEDIKESDRLGIPLVDHAPTSRGVRAIEEIIAIIDARAV
jgi:MinD-like ATPase involved in chromosome partitioning or flagellar assembly